MKRTYILTPDFDKAWTDMGLGDEDLQSLQHVLNRNPEIGTVIPGLAGARKVRIPLEGRGKSGGGRVVYVDIIVKEQIYLLTAYAKNMQTDLDSVQKKVLRKMVEFIKEE